MSRFCSIKCKKDTWSTVAEVVYILRGHGYYLKKNEVVDLALRNLMIAIKQIRE